MHRLVVAAGLVGVVLLTAGCSGVPDEFESRSLSVENELQQEITVTIAVGGETRTLHLDSGEARDGLFVTNEKGLYNVSVQVTTNESAHPRRTAEWRVCEGYYNGTVLVDDDRIQFVQTHGDPEAGNCRV